MGKCTRKSVGAIIKKEFDRDGERVLKFLLIDRKNFPYGWAAVAGHIEEGQTPEEALKAEVKEEVGLEALSFKLVVEEMVPWNNCRRSNDEGHYWHVFDSIEIEGKLKVEEEEVGGFGWFTAEEMRHLKLEPVWRVRFEKLGYI